MMAISGTVKIGKKQISNLMDDNKGIIEYKLEMWLEKGVKYPEMMKKFNTYI